MDLAGKSIAHFRIVDKLGEGGMGVVYKAVDEKLERTVAIKVLPPTLSDDEERRKRFLREARSAAAVTHANIAALHEVGEADGRVYLVMEYVEGRSLRRVLGDGVLPVAEAMRIARGIARGLARAHDKGIVHRDLKPDNVMIDTDGEPKILDFGLAKLREQREASAAPSKTVLENQATASAVTQEGQVLGTPGYMSPEQAKGRGVDHRTDLFSFGIVLYEMATGKKPFVGDSALEMIIAASRDEPEPASKVNPGVSPELAAVIDRCLAKAPGDRFADARELLKALEAIATSETNRTPGPMTPAPESSAKAKGGRTWVAIGALVAVVGVGAVALHVRLRPVSTGPAASATKVVTVTDENVPAALRPEAKAEYAAGLQALRDDSWGSATEHFRHAVAMEPGVAATHLRLAMALEATTSQADEKRAELAKAVSLRSQLGERDQAVLEALEPILGRVHPDAEEAVAKLTAASARYPMDVEILDWLGTLGGTDQKIAAATRATELDPKDGQAWENLGKGQAALGKGPDARRALEQCTRVAVDSSDCLIWKTNLDAAEGRCADMERSARRLSDFDPNNGPHSLASAIASLDGPEETVRELMGQHVAHVSENIRPFQKALADVTLAVHAGHFDEARRSIGELSALLTASGSADFPRHFTVSAWSVALAAEVGDDALARSEAQTWSNRSSTWATTGSLYLGLDASMWLARMGAAGPAEIEAARAAWVDERRRSGAPAGLLWALGWAMPALTPAEAAAALARLEDRASYAVPQPSQAILGLMPGVPEAAAGHAFLLADRAPEALPFLRSAVAACNVLSRPFIHARAALELGQALEKTGDAAGACEAYGKVVARWGDAKPRSVTAKAALARRAALGCKP